MSEEMEHNHKRVVQSSTSLKNSPVYAKTENQKKTEYVKTSVSGVNKLSNTTNDAKGTLSSKRQR